MKDSTSRPHVGFAILTLLWVIAIFWVNTRPSSHLPSGSWMKLPCFDKVVHFTMYGGMAALLWRTVVPKNPLQAAVVKMPALFCFVLPAFAGLIDEIQQRSVPGRSSDVADWIADAGGALVVVGMAVALRAIARQDRRRD
ncbi:VanZ family protein [bacterium]|nr:VanZ family protein [bacterium]